MRFKKILFIQPHYKKSQSQGPFINTGIGYISENLNINEIDNTVVDMSLGYKKEVLISKIRDYSPEIIGISLMSMQYKRNYDLIRYVKNNFKNVPVIAGGPHISTFRETALIECSDIDFGVTGDGEESLLKLCLGDEIETIPGLIYRNADRNVHYNKGSNFVNWLDKIPFPRYEKFEIDKYDSVMPLVTSRGCPYNCIFCSIKTVAGRKFRPRSVRNILDEIEYWVNRNKRVFTIRDDNFSFSKERVYEFCAGIKNRKLKNLTFRLNNGIRADKCDKELLKRMKDVGFSEIAFGVEAASNDILKEIKKGEDIEVIEKAIKNACDLDYYVNLFFMIGFPREKWKDIEKKAELAMKYPISDVAFYNIVPFPGTELYRWIDSNNLFLVKPENYLNYPSPHWINKPLFQTKEFPKKERKKAFRYLNGKIKNRVRSGYYRRKYGLFGILYFVITNNVLTRNINFKKIRFITKTKRWILSPGPIQKKILYRPR